MDILPTIRSIAFIGFEGSKDDHEVLRIISKDLGDPDFENALWLPKMYSLADGTDFLTTKDRIDVIIMMRLFDAKSEASDQISPRQSPRNWRRRLNACHAAMIYVWGNEKGDCSISDDYLGRMPGFELSQLRTGWPIARYRESRRVS